MGFFLTVVYISLALLSPADLIPSLAQFRVELVVAVLALFCSTQELLSDRFLRRPQVYLLAGLIPAVFLSQAIGNSWTGGGIVAIERLLPPAFAFYLVLLNCQSLRKLNILTSALVAIAASFMLQGGIAYLTKSYDSPFLLVGRVSTDEPTMRMRGLGLLHDPNDLAQLFVMIIPLLWLQWRTGRTFRNTFLVVLPMLFFIAGIYMTHSRGGTLALLVILMLGMKDRVGAIASMLTGSFAGLAALVMDFSGGRAISVEAGSDRTEFWGNGLQMFKSSPLFGIGMGNFVELNGGHTAHNSFVLCLAELGIVGYMLWMGLLVSTFSELNSCVNLLPTDNGADDDHASARDGGENGHFDDDEPGVSKWAKMLRISLFGYVAAACFLSRTYAFPLYIALAMAVSLCCLEQETHSIEEQPWSQLASRTAMIGFGAIACLYAFLRVRTLI